MYNTENNRMYKSESLILVTRIPILFVFGSLVCDCDVHIQQHQKVGSERDGAFTQSKLDFRLHGTQRKTSIEMNEIGAIFETLLCSAWMNGTNERQRPLKIREGENRGYILRRDARYPSRSKANHDHAVLKDNANKFWALKVYNQFHTRARPR
jgi:hypothetical protein